MHRRSPESATRHTPTTASERRPTCDAETREPSDRELEREPLTRHEFGIAALDRHNRRKRNTSPSHQSGTEPDNPPGTMSTTRRTHRGDPAFTRRTRSRERSVVRPKPTSCTALDAKRPSRTRPERSNAIHFDVSTDHHRRISRPPAPTNIDRFPSPDCEHITCAMTTLRRRRARAPREQSGQYDGAGAGPTCIRIACRDLDFSWDALRASISAAGRTPVAGPRDRGHP
ncbi:hypothetical protein KIPE111705_06885 [Kibdelosporangium persicum]